MILSQMHKYKNCIHRLEFIAVKWITEITKHCDSLYAFLNFLTQTEAAIHKGIDMIKAKN